MKKELLLANILLLNIVLGVSLVTSLLSVYLNQIGISLANIGFIFAFGAILAGFLRLPIGACVDYLGRRNFIILGALGYPIFAIGIALSKTTLHFIGFDIVLELFGAIFWTAFSAHYFDILSKGKEGVEMANRTAMQYTAVAAAPFLAGLIADRLGFTNLFYIGALISAVGVPIAAATIKDHSKNKGLICLTDFGKEYKQIMKIKGLKTLFAVLFMNNFTWTFWAIYMPIFLDQKGFSFTQIGLILSATLGAGALIQYPLGKAIDKLPAKYILIPGFGLIFLGSLVFFSLSNYFSYLAGRVVAGLGWDLSYWPAYGVFARITPKKEYGGAWAVLMAGMAWAYGIAALVGGFLTENYGIEKVLYISGVLALLTGLALISSKVLSQKGRKHLKSHQIMNHRGHSK